MGKNKTGFEVLSRKGINYGAIGSVSKLLDENSRDIDILVRPRDLKLTLQTLEKGYIDQGWILIKKITNEYATQIFFTRSTSDRFEFVQWDVMPCLTWRGLSIIDLDLALDSIIESDGIRIIDEKAIFLFKSIRTALVDDRSFEKLDTKIRKSSVSFPKWMTARARSSRASLKKSFIKNRLLKDCLSTFKFYCLNVLRLLNPPGIVVTTRQMGLEQWSNCHANSTETEKAFPYLGVKIIQHDQLSFSGRLKILKNLYLGEIIIIATDSAIKKSSPLLGSRSLGFISGNWADMDFHCSEKSPSLFEVNQFLVEKSQNVFIRK